MSSSCKLIKMVHLAKTFMVMYVILEFFVTHILSSAEEKLDNKILDSICQLRQ